MITRNPENEIRAFEKMLENAARIQSDIDWKQSWLHLQRRLAAGKLHHMRFDSFLGPEHLPLFFKWIHRIQYPDFLAPEQIETLTVRSAEADTAVFEKLGLRTDEIDLDNVARYNAQDFLLQRAYAVPPEQKPRTFLDFGAGHGRQAVLSFSPESEIECFIAIDSIPGSYLTQRMYYEALGLKLNDYMDVGESFGIERKSGLVNHLPGWRGDLIPDDSVDMVCAVQVLRELSKEMLLHALRLFQRVLKPGGALYIRDHISWHNPNQVEQDALLAATGFVLEWRPHVVDRVHTHGVPRIWRKPNPAAILGK